MTPLSTVFTIAWSVFGWIIAGLMVGLWLGERGRRRAAERREVTGSPEDGAPAAVSRAPAKEAEDRFLEATEAARKDAIDRFTAHMVEDARAKGYPVDERKFRRDAEQMIAGEDVLE